MWSLVLPLKLKTTKMWSLVLHVKNDKVICEILFILEYTYVLSTMYFNVYVDKRYSQMFGTVLHNNVNICKDEK